MSCQLNIHHNTRHTTVQDAKQSTESNTVIHRTIWLHILQRNKQQKKKKGKTVWESRGGRSSRDEAHVLFIYNQSLGLGYGSVSKFKNIHFQFGDSKRWHTLTQPWPQPQPSSQPKPKAMVLKMGQASSRRVLQTLVFHCLAWDWPLCGGK